MIKNNFIITEEERNHILNLTRLDNYRKPIRLVEDAATITAQRTYGMGGGNSPKEMTQQKTLDYDSSVKEIESLKQQGGFRDLDFANQTEVKKVAEETLNFIQNYGRNNQFGSFVNALTVASSLYPRYGYGTLVTKLSGVTNQVLNTVKSGATSYISEFNSLSDPPTQEKNNIYIIDGYTSYGNVPVWFLRNQWFSHDKIGGKADVNKKTNDNQSNDSQSQDKPTLVDFMSKSRQKADYALTDDACVSLFRSYINDIIPGNISPVPTDQDLRNIKRVIAHCFSEKRYENKYNKDGSIKKNIFGKVVNKTSGGALSKLSKKLKKQYLDPTSPDCLTTRTDKFKINLTGDLDQQP
jgi:hypothetical protein